MTKTIGDRLNGMLAQSYLKIGEAIAPQTWGGKNWGLVANSCYRRAVELSPETVQEWQNSVHVEPEDPQKISVPNPIFIVGCGYSGTSLMIALLGSHPSIFPIAGESGLFRKSPSEIREMLQIWDRQCLNSEKKRWIEKTPAHIYQIPKILKYRPDSQLILMLRDGRDVVCSLKYRKQYNDFTTRVRQWVAANLVGLPYWNHPRVKVVKYENLVVNTTKTIQEILDFLQEDFSQEVVNFHQQPKYWYSSEIEKPTELQTTQDHQKFRNWQINQPIFDGRGRWKKEMSAEEKAIMKKKAQKYLVQFGYAENEDW